MTNAAAGAAAGIPEHSAESQPLAMEAACAKESDHNCPSCIPSPNCLGIPAAPSHTGVNAHTSFKVISRPESRSTCQALTDSSCMPG